MDRLVDTEDLAALGITEELIADGVGDISLLEGPLTVASSRMKSWIGDARYADLLSRDSNDNSRRAAKQAELQIALTEILPVLWMQGSAGEKSIKVDDFSISLATPSFIDQQSILIRFLNIAESTLERMGMLIHNSSSATGSGLMNV